MSWNLNCIIRLCLISLSLLVAGFCKRPFFKFLSFPLGMILWQVWTFRNKASEKIPQSRYLQQQQASCQMEIKNCSTVILNLFLNFFNSNFQFIALREVSFYDLIISPCMKFLLCWHLQYVCKYIYIYTYTCISLHVAGLWYIKKVKCKEHQCFFTTVRWLWMSNFKWFVWQHIYWLCVWPSDQHIAIESQKKVFQSKACYCWENWRGHKS